MRSSQSEEAKWEKQYSQLRSYVKKQGHSKVPINSKHSELSDWVKLQRSERRKGALSEDRVAQLDKLNFWWGKDKKDKKSKKGVKAERDNFEEFYVELQDFYREKGHTRAPLTTSLGVWAQKQRTKLREDTISPEHRARLEEINFDYELQSEKNKKNISDKGNTWESQCDLLAAFYQDHGHFVIPKRHHLSNWVASQRRAYSEGRLKKERREKLEGIHFIWTDAAAVESQKTWETNYDKLKRFKQRKGHSFVQRDDDILLWRWTEKNDWRQRRGTLPRKRYERLGSIGFWDPPPDRLSERGDSTNQDEADIAFVVASMSDDGDANNRAGKKDSDAESNGDSSGEEEEDEGDDNYDDDDDDSTDDDDNLEEDEDGSPISKAKRSRKAAPANSRTKKKRSNIDKKSSARKRLRRSSTFDDEEGFSTRYQVGTKVMKYFKEHGWFQGEIISIYEQNVYKIRYEDEDEETYLIPNEQKDLDQIVANTDLLRYEVGTKIKKHFEGHGWFEGKVIDREEDRYKVRYSDGDKEEYLFHELDQLDELVSNARSQ